MTLSIQNTFGINDILLTKIYDYAEFNYVEFCYAEGRGNVHFSAKSNFLENLKFCPL
jgi:hypothetical protein